MLFPFHSLFVERSSLLYFFFLGIGSGILIRINLLLSSLIQKEERDMYLMESTSYVERPSAF